MRFDFHFVSAREKGADRLRAGDSQIAVRSTKVAIDEIGEAISTLFYDGASAKLARQVHNFYGNILAARVSEYTSTREKYLRDIFCREI